MSAKVWGRANAAKVITGAFLALVVAPFVDVLARRWPSGGAR